MMSRRIVSFEQMGTCLSGYALLSNRIRISRGDSFVSLKIYLSIYNSTLFQPAVGLIMYSGFLLKTIINTTYNIWGDKHILIICISVLHATEINEESIAVHHQ